MRITKLYRVILALSIAVLSTASAMHDIVHHGHGHEESMPGYSATADHESHAEGCEFCAKGPTVSLDVETVVLSFVSPTETILFPYTPPQIITNCDLLAQLRGPPAA